MQKKSKRTMVAFQNSESESTRSSNGKTGYCESKCDKTYSPDEYEWAILL
eukprot:COSAG02_NODE_338_length_24206_cov_94.612685_2_plen_50_part_00